jgi:hypothetical protein
MSTVLGAAVHVANNAAPLHGSGSSASEVLGIGGAALALTVLWVMTRFLPRGERQPAATVTQSVHSTAERTSRLAASRPERRARAPRKPVVR